MKNLLTLLMFLTLTSTAAAQEFTPEQMEEGMRLVEEFMQANPICESVIDRIVDVMERDKSITPTAACVRALEVERRARAQAK